MSTALRRRVVSLEVRAAAEAAFPKVPRLALRGPADVVGLLAEQADAVRNDPHADPMDRARTLTSIGGMALRAMDAAEGRARLEALERALKVRAEQQRAAEKAKKQRR